MQLMISTIQLVISLIQLKLMISAIHLVISANKGIVSRPIYHYKYKLINDICNSFSDICKSGNCIGLDITISLYMNWR